MFETIKKIALEYFGVIHWETRGLDRLDFHDVSVGSIRKALQKAYEDGFHAGHIEGYDEGQSEGYTDGYVDGKMAAN